MPTLALVIEAPILVLAAIGAGGPESALPILFPALIFRVFHSSVPGYIGAVGVAAAAYVGTGIVWPALHGVDPSGAVSLLIGNLMAIPLMGKPSNNEPTSRSICCCRMWVWAPA